MHATAVIRSGRPSLAANDPEERSGVIFHLLTCRAEPVLVAAIDAGCEFVDDGTLDKYSALRSVRKDRSRRADRRRSRAVRRGRRRGADRSWFGRSLVIALAPWSRRRRCGLAPKC